MGNKIRKLFKDNKKNFIIFTILWLLADIVLIAPLAVAISTNTSVIGGLDVSGMFSTFIAELMGFKAIFKIFKAGTFGVFVKSAFWMWVICFVLFIISVIQGRSKHEFTDIEHGSSDWSEGGEQYRILDKRKGIVLAEKNYLPVNKIGNVNVMVIGRFWFW